MNEDPRIEQLYAFLVKVRSLKLVNIRNLSGDEIVMAEELVSAGLLKKISTRVTSVYIYEERGK